jgi:hypothetical protein
MNDVTPRSGAPRSARHWPASTARWLALFSCALLLPELASAHQVNLARFQATTVDSVYSSSEAPIQNATDGVANNDSRRYVLSGSPHWLQVQLPLAMTVGSAQVFLGIGDGLTVTNFPIQYLDNASNWVICPGASITGNTLAERNIVFTSDVTAQVFRFYSTDARWTDSH